MPNPAFSEFHIVFFSPILVMAMKRLHTPEAFLVSGIVANDALLVSGHCRHGGRSKLRQFIRFVSRLSEKHFKFDFVSKRDSMHAYIGDAF